MSLPTDEERAAGIRACHGQNRMRAIPFTFIELLATYPGLFYRQAWYDGEAFLRVLPNEPVPHSPSRIVRRGGVPKSNRGLPLAVDLANAYVLDPMNPVWDDWIWCRDTDRLGRRIYVGGLSEGHGFQIHRYFVVDGRWGCAA